MKRGRPIKYTDNEERKQAIRDSKTIYMLNKDWICNVCPSHNYTLASKHMHLKTKKHIYNTIKKALEDDDDINLITDE